MKIPFSIDEFLGVFERYNLSLWPIQVFFYILALVAIGLIVKRATRASQLAMAILAFFWAWMGVIYHIVYFSQINNAAYLFGTIFIIQALLFFYFGVVAKEIQLEFNLNLSGVIASLLIVYALIVYPLVGYLIGRIYPRTPTFGVPCPTTIFTFGLLLFAKNRIRWYLIVLPFLWSVVGFSAAINLSIKEDFGLVVAGVLATFLLVFIKPRLQT